MYLDSYNDIIERIVNSFICVNIFAQFLIFFLSKGRVSEEDDLMIIVIGIYCKRAKLKAL